MHLAPVCVQKGGSMGTIASRPRYIHRASSSTAVHVSYTAFVTGFVAHASECESSEIDVACPAETDTSWCASTSCRRYALCTSFEPSAYLQSAYPPASASRSAGAGASRSAGAGGTSGMSRQRAAAFGRRDSWEAH